MKHGLSTLALSEVSEPLVKKSMLKEANPLMKLLSGAGNEAKAIGKGGLIAGGGLAGGALGAGAGLLGMGTDFDGPGNQYFDGSYLDQLGALTGGGVAGGTGGTLAGILLAGLLRKRLGTTMTTAGAGGTAGGIGAGLGIGSLTADALKG